MFKGLFSNIMAFYASKVYVKKQYWSLGKSAWGVEVEGQASILGNGFILKFIWITSTEYVPIQVLKGPLQAVYAKNSLVLLFKVYTNFLWKKRQ